MRLWYVLYCQAMKAQAYTHTHLSLFCLHTQSMDVVDYSGQRGTCIKGLFWPPIEPKTENCFSPISFNWFIRRITEV